MNTKGCCHSFNVNSGFCKACMFIPVQIFKLLKNVILWIHMKIFSKNTWGVDVNNAWPLTCKASKKNRVTSLDFGIWLCIVGGTESVCGFPTANKRSIKLETAVTWSKSNLNMMNIYEEGTLNFWIWKFCHISKVIINSNNTAPSIGTIDIM